MGLKGAHRGTVEPAPARFQYPMSGSMGLKATDAANIWHWISRFQYPMSGSMGLKVTCLSTTASSMQLRFQYPMSGSMGLKGPAAQERLGVVRHVTRFSTL